LHQQPQAVRDRDPQPSRLEARRRVGAMASAGMS
jgi:hypothetical protein